MCEVNDLMWCHCVFLGDIYVGGKNNITKGILQRDVRGFYDWWPLMDFEGPSIGNIYIAIFDRRDQTPDATGKKVGSFPPNLTTVTTDRYICSS